MSKLHSELHHSPRILSDPSDWTLYLSHAQPMRLIVFVHGFAGHGVRTWQQFAGGGEHRAWWRTADMLFVGYDSKRENITGVANRLRTRLREFYPDLPAKYLEAGNACVRSPVITQYEELYVVGHSLGGVIVRRALSDTAQSWIDERKLNPLAARPSMLDARLRLFSPASAGFRAAGSLGMIHAAPFWFAIDMYLRRSSAFSDLQPGSEVLESVRRRTLNCLQADGNLAALRAHILWANPDDVVIPERYDTDHPDVSADDTSHTSVCKPTSAYVLPWAFVEQGHSA